MDRARQYTTVKDFERRNPHEVEYHDHAYDHQMLLNQTDRPAEVTELLMGASPRNGATRAEERPWMAAADDREAAKLVTETWEEYAVRVGVREENLERFFAEQRATEAAEAIQKDQRAKVSQTAVERLMAYEAAYKKQHYRAPLHTLRTDFGALSDNKMRTERDAIEQAANATRVAFAKDEEVPARRVIEVEAANSFQRVLDVLERQHQARVAEEQRRQEEARQREAERKAEIERQKAAEAAADLARRQAEADAKMAEQRRRADERKAKAKAERKGRNNSVGPAGGAAPPTPNTQPVAGGGGSGADASLDAKPDTPAGDATIATADTTLATAEATLAAAENTAVTDSTAEVPPAPAAEAAASTACEAPQE